MIDPNAEIYVVGDILKKTSFYESTYPSWSVTEGAVIAVKKSSVRDVDLGKEDRPTYHARYGFQKEYPIYGISIQSNGVTFIVSQLGFNKDNA